MTDKCIQTVPESRSDRDGSDFGPADASLDPTLAAIRQMFSEADTPPAEAQRQQPQTKPETATETETEAEADAISAHAFPTEAAGRDPVTMRDPAPATFAEPDAEDAELTAAVGLLMEEAQDWDMDDAGEEAPALAPASTIRRFAARPLSLTATAVLLLLAQFLRRPDAPRLIAVALLSYFFYTRPWLLPGLIGSVVVLTGLVYYLLGAERISYMVVAWHVRLRQRDPARAEHIRRRAARLSRRLAGVIERLPENWTTGLYLPDFETAPELPEKMQNDPFERLAAQLREHAGAAAEPETALHS